MIHAAVLVQAAPETSQCIGLRDSVIMQPSEGALQILIRDLSHCKTAIRAGLRPWSDAGLYKERFL